MLHLHRAQQRRRCSAFVSEIELIEQLPLTLMRVGYCWWCLVDAGEGWETCKIFHSHIIYASLSSIFTEYMYFLAETTTAKFSRQSLFEMENFHYFWCSCRFQFLKIFPSLYQLFDGDEFVRFPSVELEFDSCHARIFTLKLWRIAFSGSYDELNMFYIFCTFFSLLSAQISSYRLQNRCNSEIR